MTNFTEAQLTEIATAFGLTFVESLPVRDGRVTKTTKVWWRSAEGPELVEAGHPDHWRNIELYPGSYQLARPKVDLQYKD